MATLKELTGSTGSSDSGDSTGEGVADGGLTFPDRTPSLQPISMSAGAGQPVPTQVDSAGEIDFPDKWSKLQGVYAAVQGSDANRAAKVIALQGTTGQSPAFIDKNLDVVQKAANTPPTSFFKELEDKYPGTTQFLSDPKNMVVAQDDIPNVTQHEDLVNRASKEMGTIDWLKSVFDPYAKSFEYGLESSLPALAIRQAMPDVVPPQNPNFAERFLTGAGSLAGDLPGMMVSGVAGALAGSAAGPVGTFAGGAIGGFGVPAAVKAAVQQKIQNGEITSYSDILKEFAKQSAVGLATGGAGIAGKAVAGTFGALAAENVAMTAAGKGVEGQVPTGQDFLDNTLLTLGAHYGIHGAIGMLQSDKADLGKTFYTALGDTADASKMRNRLPEAHQALVDQLTKDGPVENVYIPAEAATSYFQGKGIDPDHAMAELGVTSSFNEAKQTGGDVQIPLSTWINKVSKEHYQGLADDIKFDPEDMTTRQVNDRKADIQSQVKALMDQQQQDDAKQATLDLHSEKTEEFSNVYKKVQQQLQDAGLSGPEAEFNPKVHEAFYNTLGAKLGISPDDLAERYPLQINGPDSEATPDASAPDERMAAQNQDGKEFDQSATGQPTRIEDELQTKIPIPDKVPLVSIEGGAELKDLSREDLRKGALNAAQKEIPRGLVENEHTGLKVNVSSEGLKKSAIYAVRPEQAAALNNIHELIEKGTYLRSEADRNKGNVKYDYLYTPFEYDGDRYVAKIALRDSGSGVGDQTFYSLHAMKVDGSLGDSSDYKSEGSAEPTSPKGSGVDKSDLLRSVNQARETTERFQSAPKVEAGPRGRIRIGPNGYAIDLFKSADRSTFLHETGHYFLDVMGHVADDLSAPADVKEDYQTILKWLGVDSTGDIGTEEHEKFARGFEQYLMEGKAPSSALDRAFSRFRKWLTSVYQNVKSLNVPMSDDVRGVMDRMLASKEEIDKASSQVGLSGDSLRGLPPEVEAKMLDLQSRARDQAEGALLKEQMKEMTTERKAFLVTERERQIDIAEKAVDEMPVFKAGDEAVATIGKDRTPGTIAEKFLSEKLEPADQAKFETLAQEHGFDSGDELAHSMILAEEQKSRQSEIDARTEAGMAPHADMMDSDKIKGAALEAVHGEKMTELLALERQTLSDLVHREEVKQEAKRRNKAEADAQKAEEQQAASQEQDLEKRKAIIEKIQQRFEDRFKAQAAAEIAPEVSRRNRLEARVEAAAAKEQAKAILSEKPIKEAANARPYVTAERNAAVKAAKALAKGDYEAAAEAKRQQMLNHAIAGEAMKNQKEVGKSVDFLSDYAKRKNDLMKMPYGFMRQVDQLLSKFGFAPEKQEDTATLQKIAMGMAQAGEETGEIANRTGFMQDPTGNWKQETLPDFVARANDGYHALSLPDSVLNSVGKNYEDLTLSDLRDVKNSVKTIADLGKKYDRFLGDFKTMDVRQAAGDFRKSVAENFGTPFASGLQPGSAHATKMSEMISSLPGVTGFFNRWLDTMLTTCNKFDGVETSATGKISQKEGPAKEFIYRPLEDASNREAARTAQKMKEVDGIFSKHYDLDEFAKYKDTRINVDGRYFTKSEILSMALNWGNETNRDRLMKGFGFDEPKMDRIFKNLDKKDWDFAQNTWNHLNEYWPEISKLEMDVNGVEPGKVASAPFQNEHGSYEGGYYPIKYDFEKSADAYKNQQSRDALYKQFSTAGAATEQGHAAARVANVTRPISLDIGVIKDHHEDVIHDLEFRRPVIDVNRFLNQKDVKAGIVNAVGVKGYAGMADWLKAAAGGGSEPIGGFDKAAQWLRFKSTFYNLGYRIASAPKIAIENFVNVSSEVGVSSAARVLKDYYSNSAGMHDMVTEKSDFMRLRGEHLNRDFSDIHNKWQGTEQGPFKKFAFLVHSYLDQGASFPLWADTYKSGIAEHGEEKLAINLADESVKRAFMSGGTIDQPAIMRGGEIQKALTTAYGYQSMMWNRFSMQKFAANQAWVQGNHTAAVAIAARAAIYTFILPAAVTALSAELMRNTTNTNSDDQKKRMAAKAMEEMTPLKFVPVLRDMSPYLIKKALGEKGSDLQLTPLEESAQTILSDAGDAFHAFGGHGMPDKFPEHTANAISLLAGCPKEINDIAFNFIDWQQKNGALTWKDAVSRKTKK